MVILLWILPKNTRSKDTLQTNLNRYPFNKYGNVSHKVWSNDLLF